MQRVMVTTWMIGLGVLGSVAVAQPSDLDVMIDALSRIQDQGRRHNLPRPARDQDFYERDPAKEDLGKLLFFDKILSGNLNISCATCHHPFAGTADGLSLPVGEGGMGTSTARDLGMGADRVHERVPRNAPAIFNLGAREFITMFHDGRVQADSSEPGGFRSPAGAALPEGLDNVLAAQAMFPVTSGTEMAGQDGENAIGTLAAAGDLVGIWDALATRLQGIDGYVQLFIDAFPEINSASDITYVHAANAIAAFEASAWRADDTPFDRYLRGDQQAMTKAARDGARLFYRGAGCAECHAGVFQTSQEFSSIAMPQIGPGKGDNLPGDTGGRNDFGREQVTGDPDDRFQFRVPSLRNVALTGPWGHGGAFSDLELMVRHHLDPAASLLAYDPSQAILPSDPDLDAIDFTLIGDPDQEAALLAASRITPRSLREREFEAIMEFLYALTDRRSLDMRLDTPARVPSGLPVFD